MTVRRLLYIPTESLQRPVRRSPWLRRLWRLTLTLLLFFFVYVGVVRPWYMRWGATDQEVTEPLPGDPMIPPSAVVSTRAITIHAPPEKIWPWLVQLGQERGGFYSYTWLENLFAADMVNAERIDPRWQNLRHGDVLSFGEGWYTTRVSMVEPDTLLMLGDWGFYLRPVDAQTTRLVIRYPYVVGKDTLGQFFYYGIFEPAHFVMESGMMMGIKARAEGQS